MKPVSFLSLVAGTVVALGAIGSLGPMSAAADDTQPSSATFSKEVSRIFQSKCQECHRPGELAPMSFLTYAEARPWAKSIKKAVAAQTMPPWHADPRYGKWSNDISLTQEQIDTIVKWVDAGAPEGNPADLPEPRKFEQVEWKGGEPDLKYFPPATYTVPAATEDEYRCMVVPSNFQEDTWIQGFEYKVDNRAVVHHIIGFFDVTGQARAKDAEDPQPGFLCGAGGGIGANGIDSMLGGWAPGTPPNIYRAGYGKLIPKGADMIIQMHYHNETGKDQVDHSGIGIHLARQTIKARGRIMPVSAWKLNIAAGDPNAEAKSQWRVPQDISLQSLMPHMHYIGKDMTMSVAYPDGKNEILLSVPRYDFNWQTVYGYPEPKMVPKGSLIYMVAHHDNSAENPRNPRKPPQDVHWGEETQNEMAIGWVGYYFTDENLNITPKPAEQVIGEVKAATKKETVSSKAN